MKLNKFTEEVHQNAVEHGWWDEAKGVDLEGILDIKHAYNKTRPYRHGGKAL